MTKSLDVRFARRRFLASRQPLTVTQTPAIASTSSSASVASTGSSFESLEYRGFDTTSGKYKAYNPTTEEEQLVDLIVDGETGGYPTGTDILVSQGTATFG